MNKLSPLALAVAAHLGSLDITMREAAAQSGVALSVISKVVNGSTPSLKNFAALCWWAGLDANAMLEIRQGKTDV